MFKAMNLRFSRCKKSFKNIDYIITEINRDELYKGCAKIEEVDSFLSSFGFRRVMVNWAEKPWGDAFYIKNYKTLLEKVRCFLS